MTDESKAELVRILAFRGKLEAGARKVKERAAELGWGLVNGLFYGVREESSEMEKAIQGVCFASVDEVRTQQHL